MHIFISDLKEGQYIESVYLVRERSFGTAKNGSQYISLELADKTGMVDARMWDASKKTYDTFNIDEFVKVKARVESYKGYPQLKLDSIYKIEESSIDISAYLPTVSHDIGEMFDSFLKEISSIKDPFIKKLLENIFMDEKKQGKFKRSPAATDFHHPYIGGLLEHTLNSIILSKLVASRYADINADLLIAGAALHDIGKTEELSYSRSFYYNDKGRLIGHIVLGANIIEKEMDKIDGFPEEIKNLLIHLILSHHGEYEWGSPKRPMCLEAIVLHYIDNIDAKVNGFKQFVTTYNDPDTNWTKYSKMFKEFLYKKNLSKEEE